MGCFQSKMEDEEAITSCKDRHYFMKQAVSARNNFAAAHSSYAASLKNTGAALIDFAQGEQQQNLLFSPSYDVPLPPPPLPDLPAALRRAITMPEFESDMVVEEEEDGDDDEEVVEGCGLSDERKDCGRVKESVNMDMIQILSEVDNHFIMASEAARGVSVILQATRLHFHSNFSDTARGNHKNPCSFLLFRTI